jgi:hypothetical protein
MVHASLRGWRPARLPALVLGGLLVAGLLSILSVSQAAPPRGSATRGRGTTPATKPAPTLKLTFASGDSDLVEMTKVINTELEAGWKANKVTPSNYADDYEFIRRASLDIIGRIATAPELRTYFKDPPDKRRSLLIERLLKHEDYARHWANLWSNWLLTRSGPFGRGLYHDQMALWLEDQFAQNKHYDEIVKGLLTAKGSNKDNGAVNFILAHVGEGIRNTRENAKRIEEEGRFEMVPLTSRLTRLFLGIQVQCAQCHAHPFSGNLKQKQFWGINAFLGQVRREGNPTMMRRDRAPPTLTLVDDEAVNTDPLAFYEERNGKVRMQRAEFLPSGDKTDGPRLDPKLQGLDRRKALADFIIGHEMFPKAIVNRLWGLFFGRGFVNPVDDFNDNNLPSNPELLNELASRFKHYNYDLKKLIHWITNSNAYHLSYVANKTNDKVEQEPLFSRMIMKSMTPEQLFESLMVATRAEQADSAATKNALRKEWLRNLILNFGDDEGNEVIFNGTVVQALLMMNGKDINDAIARKDKGTVALALKTNRTLGGVITELYLTALNRPPRPMEMNLVINRMALRSAFAAKDRAAPAAKFEDLFWALLNSNEFILNH